MPGEDRRQQLRHQIALYRDLLQRGPSLRQAARYLEHVMDAEAELQRINRIATQPQVRVVD
jgi:hypothetical protein